MTDPPGRQPVPRPAGSEPEGRLPVPRPPSDVAPAERFTAPPAIHNTSLSPERAAEIVRQSGSARWVGFVATLVVIIFIIVYYFYDLGVPGISGTSRLTAEANAQQVMAVENGYTIYEANCSRCHGVQGQGGIGPVLNDQSKLFVHLNERYIRNVLLVGGRYVCGNPTSLMPVWDQRNGGPLNYEQINNLVAFLRAPNTETFVVRDPATKEPLTDASGKVQTFSGWRDPNYKPAPGATPFPDCWTEAFKSGASPAASASGSAAPAPAGSGATSGPVVTITAENLAFTQASVEAPAGQPFTIAFENKDPSIQHNVDIKDASGASVYKGEIVSGVSTVNYSVPALPAGNYTFICDVHVSMTGTLTAK